MINNKILALAFAGLMSTCSLYALAAEKTTEGSALPPGTAQPQGTDTNGVGTGTDAGSSTKGIDRKTGSMSNGADAGTTDNGPAPSGGSKGGGEGKGNGTGS
jgi:hypothetical protein